MLHFWPNCRMTKKPPHLEEPGIPRLPFVCQRWHTIAGETGWNVDIADEGSTPVTANECLYLFPSLFFQIPGPHPVSLEMSFQIFQQIKLILSQPEAAIVVTRFREILPPSPLVQRRNSYIQTLCSFRKKYCASWRGRSLVLTTAVPSAGLNPLFAVFLILSV